MKKILIAGTASGVGKTTVTLAIEAALVRRGLRVQPCKCGPDYLDPSHHGVICQRPSRNLDTIMLSREENEASLRYAARSCDIVVAEGVMGLFDGVDGASERGSSAEIAKMLGFSVILVLDAKASARSLAAVLQGFERFDSQLAIDGVILNRVYSEGHFKMLREAIESNCRAKILGWLPCDDSLRIDERHLGVHHAQEKHWSTSDVEKLANFCEEHLNLDQLLELASEDNAIVADEIAAPIADEERVRNAVARDEICSFYYEDNLDLLREAGADIIDFSPLHDATLPECEALYLGGGYPELHAEALSKNHAMMAALRAYCASGKPVYGECGGMMMLARSLRVGERRHAMIGALPIDIEMTDRLVDFGYARMRLTNSCLFGEAGLEATGHSFHYSRVTASDEARSVYQLRHLSSGREQIEGYANGSVLGSYLHLHFRANRELAKNFVAAARRAKL